MHLSASDRRSDSPDVGGRVAVLSGSVVQSSWPTVWASTMTKSYSSSCRRRARTSSCASVCAGQVDRLAQPLLAHIGGLCKGVARAGERIEWAWDRRSLVAAAGEQRVSLAGRMPLVVMQRADCAPGCRRCGTVESEQVKRNRSRASSTERGHGIRVAVANVAPARRCRNGRRPGSTAESRWRADQAAVCVACGLQNGAFALDVYSNAEGVRGSRVLAGVEKLAALVEVRAHASDHRRWSGRDAVAATLPGSRVRCRTGVPDDRIVVASTPSGCGAVRPRASTS